MIINSNNLLMKYLFFFQKVEDRLVPTPARFVKISWKETRRAGHCRETKRPSMVCERIRSHPVRACAIPVGVKRLEDDIQRVHCQVARI